MTVACVRIHSVTNCAHTYLRFWSKKDGLDHGLDVTRLRTCVKRMAVRTTSVGCECHSGPTRSVMRRLLINTERVT